MKSMYALGGGLFLFALAVAAFFTLRNEDRRSKSLAFVSSIVKGVKKYTVDLFKNTQNVGPEPTSDEIPVSA